MEYKSRFNLQITEHDMNEIVKPRSSKQSLVHWSASNPGNFLEDMMQAPVISNFKEQCEQEYKHLKIAEPSIVERYCENRTSENINFYEFALLPKEFTESLNGPSHGATIA